MARLIAYSKDHLIYLQSSENNKLILSQNSLVLLPYSKEQVVSLERSGTTAIIHLKNGEQIVLENFFTVDGAPAHSIVLSNPAGYYDVAVLAQDGQLIQYNPVSNLNQLLGSPNWISSTQVNAIQEAAEAQPWYKGAWVKPALLAVAAEAIYLTALKKDDDKPTAPKDTIAPSAPKGTLDSDGKVIVGQAEAGAKVFVIDSKFNVLAEATVGSDGSYTLNLSRAVTDGEKAYVYAQDQAGNKSSYLSLTGTKDTIKPEVTQAQFSEDGAFVSGKTEAKAKVYLYSEDGETLLAGPFTAANDGTFTIILGSQLGESLKAKVVAIDEAGNRSDAYIVEVGKDTVAPSQPHVEVNTDGTSIKGTAEIGAKVLILDQDGNIINDVIVAADGTFQINLTGGFTGNSNYKLVVKDAAENESKAILLKPGFDTLAPAKVQASLNADGNKLTGTAEANSTIEIRASDNTLLGTGKANASGHFEITLSKALVNNSVANVVAIDAAKNTSPALQVVGTKDTIQPNKVVLTSVTDEVGSSKGSISANDTTDDARPKFAGTGEVGATVTIYNHEIAIGTTIVQGNGKWTFQPTVALVDGQHSFSFTQMDAATNTSDMSESFKFTVNTANSNLAGSEVVNINTLFDLSLEPSEVDTLLNQVNMNTQPVSLFVDAQFNQTNDAAIDSFIDPLIIG